MDFDNIRRIKFIYKHLIRLHHFTNNIKDTYSDLNTIQYINYEHTIINNYTLFNNEIITTDLLYLSHIYINLHNKNPNTYNIQIYKNGSVMEN